MHVGRGSIGAGEQGVHGCRCWVGGSTGKDRGGKTGASQGGVTGGVTDCRWGWGRRGRVCWVTVGQREVKVREMGLRGWWESRVMSVAAREIAFDTTNVSLFEFDVCLAFALREAVSPC